MNAHIIKGPSWNPHGSQLFRCSACQYSIPANSCVEAFKFCWNCGVKFGPEPKAEPTGGDWWYNHATGNINANLGGKANTVASVSLANPPSEQEANGHVLAASKKLLAVAKRVVEFGMQTPIPKTVSMAQEAIAAAEGK